MKGYVISPAAQADLGEIWDYSARNWGAEQADRYILAIRGACEALAAGSRRGRAIDDIRPGYRKLAVASHFLFYRITDPGNGRCDPRSSSADGCRLAPASLKPAQILPYPLSLFRPV
jgi:toxin ParE1/3/4